MDTLSPPPPAAAAQASAPADLLRARSRRQRWGRPLLFADAGLVLTLVALWGLHPSLLRVESWSRLSLAWMAGLGVTFLGALTLWIADRRSPPLRHARSLDENLRASNRLETAALLESHADPLARAQREETALFLADSLPARRGPDYLKLLRLALGAAILAHFATLTVWTRPWQRPVSPPVPTAPTPPPAAPPRAVITWKTPQSEIKASPVEEVPLAALADSASGLRDLVLDAAVNGEPRPSVAVPVDALGKPGAHPIQTSLFLDQLDVQPYDVVSYFLRAKRVTQGNFPDVVSPVQFVEVKPFRDDVKEMPGGDGAGMFGLLLALKAGQLNLIKQNFVLAHAEISHETAAWKKENARVGNEQATLGAKADEVIAQYIQKGLPANIVDLLQQSRAQMAASADRILAGKNLEALPVQGKSLGFITEIEKYFIKLAAKDGSSKGGPKNVRDPFEKPKDFELKQRFETVAGGLEALAHEQLKLAQELAKADPKDPNAGQPTPEPANAEPKKPDPNRIEGTFTERQTLIAQRVGALLNAQALPPEVNAHLASGQDHARESLRQLDADDIAQAREPAAAAARELRLAVQATDKLGQDNANDKLADALNRLNKAADEARDASQAKSDADARKAAEDAAAQAADARDKLAEAARQQQETGSAQAADRLAAGVRALDDPKLRDALKQWHDQPRNDALGKAAADRLTRAAEEVADQRGSQRSADEIAKLVERVERTRQNLARLVAAQPRTASGSVAPSAEVRPAQPANGAVAPVSPPNGELPSGTPSAQNVPGQAFGKDGQTPGPGGEPPKDSPSSGKEGAGKAAQSPNGKGKEGPGQSKGRDGQGKEPGQEGQGKGPGKGKDDQSQGQGQGGKGQGAAGADTPGQTPSGQPGQAGGAPGNGHGAGHGSATDRSAEGKNANASPLGGPSSDDHHGDPDARGGSGNAGIPRSDGWSDGNPSSHQQAKELQADLRDELLEARVILVSPDARPVLEDLVPDIHSPRPANNVSVVASYDRIRAPLDRLISLLRTELERSQRQHELTDQTLEKAPLAYGDAVADYFEQLSRDYQPSATPAPATPAETATPASP